jgi:hypothetical protein
MYVCLYVCVIDPPQVYSVTRADKARLMMQNTLCRLLSAHHNNLSSFSALTMWQMEDNAYPYQKLQSY